MKQLVMILILLGSALQVGGAATPDVITPGYKIVHKDMRVDPGELAKTHFVFTVAGGDLSEVSKDVPIRAYIWETRIYAAPLAQKKQIMEAMEAVAKRRRNPGASSEPTQSPLSGLPSSEPLEGRETVVESDPTHAIEVRYQITGIQDGKVILTKTRRLLDKEGKEITPEQAEEAKRSFSVLLALVAAVGVVGVAILAARRASAV